MLSRGRRQRVLRDINKIRAQLGSEPITELPRSRPATSLAYGCPLACAIGGDGVVGCAHWALRDEAEQHGDLLPVLQRFVADFDAGLFPELQQS